MAQAFPLSRFLGRALLVVARVSAVILSMVLLSLPFRGTDWQEFNSNTLLGIFYQPWLSVVLAIGMLAYLAARFRLIPKHQARMTDMLYLAVVVGVLGVLQAIAYLPVLQAPPV